MKAEYKEALKHESKLQTKITRLDERITQAMADDNNSRPMLLQEKEVLLEEIRRLNSLVRSEGEKVSKRLPRHVFCKVLRERRLVSFKTFIFILEGTSHNSFHCEMLVHVTFGVL